MHRPSLRALNYWFLISSALLCGLLWFYVSVSIPGVLQFDAEGPDKIFFSKSAFPGYIGFILTHCFIIRFQEGKIWPDLLEVVLRLIETIAATYFVAGTSIVVRQQGHYHVVLYILLGCIHMLVICKITYFLTLIWDVTSGGQFLQRQFVTGRFGRQQSNLRNRQLDSPETSMFRKRYKSETNFETRLRGVLAISLLLVFGMVTLFVILVQPLEDVNKIGKHSFTLPEKQWSRMTLPHMAPQEESTTWSVLVQSPYNPKLVREAMEVTFNTSILGSILAANSSFEKVSPLLPTVSLADVRQIQYSPGPCNPDNSTSGTDFVHFICNSRGLTYNNAFPSSSASTVMTIRVNFTKLGPEIQLQQGQVFEIGGAIKLMLGMADRPEDIMEDAIPFLLFPNINLISTVSLSLRQKVKNFSLGVIGFPQYYTFPVAHVETLFPDPIDPNPSAGTSRLKIFLPTRNPEYARYTLNQDSVQSALARISFLGGLWTTINGIFAFIFGCSVLLVSLGIKPLSIYGLIHLVRKDRPALSDGSSMSIEEQAQILALLRQHLLDIPEFKMETRQSFDGKNDNSQERLLPGQDEEPEGDDGRSSRIDDA